jgi:CheY-like chemotaxis protein
MAAGNAPRLRGAAGARVFLLALVTKISDDDAFALTGKGQAELKAAGTALSVTELQLLVLLDGFSTVAQIARLLPGIGRADIDAALASLLQGRMILNTTGSDSDEMASGFSTISVPAGFFASLTDATPEAEGGAALLKQQGYYVRIARNTDHNPRPGWKPTILVVDDDPDLQKLIRTYFSLEGFHMRAALKRDDILIALRMQPMPDLVLLDVQLPDANGFEILARMRQHPVLKNMPVVMLTAEDTREAVLKGLQGGADGYVTKPFEADALVKAVKSVLGLLPPPAEKKK